MIRFFFTGISRVNDFMQKINFERNRKMKFSLVNNKKK